MNISSITKALVNEYSTKCQQFFKTRDYPLIFSTPDTSQGKLQTYAMLAMFFRKEGNITSSDQFLMYSSDFVVLCGAVHC